MKQSSVKTVFVQLVKATRASTTFPMCSLRLRSATAREISISDICNKNRSEVSGGSPFRKSSAAVPPGSCCTDSIKLFFAVLCSCFSSFGQSVNKKSGHHVVCLLLNTEDSLWHTHPQYWAHQTQRCALKLISNSLCGARTFSLRYESLWCEICHLDFNLSLLLCPAAQPIEIRQPQTATWRMRGGPNSSIRKNSKTYN